MILAGIQFFLGLFILSVGSDWLVRSTVSLAYRLKKKVFFIALFLLGMGTSAPELFVTLQSHLNQEPDMAIGNIVGSNIFNILIVGALTLLTAFPARHKSVILKSTGLLLAVTAAVGVVLFDFSLSLWNGIFLLILFSLFFIGAKNPEQFEESQKSYSMTMTFVFLAGGFILLFAGTQATLSSAVQLGDFLGFSKRITGLFLLSVGTSLPELAVAVTALVKRNSEIALGNIVGSNAFNTLFIPGLAALFSVLPVSKEIITIDGPVMIFSELLLLLFLLGSRKLPRIGVAVFFIASYIVYAYFVLLHRV